jgi:hypothetical protein
VQDYVLASEDFEGTRKYLETIVWQINGCYQFGFYDACAVLCRRLTESLLISVYETKDEAGAIRKGDGNFMMLNDILGVVRRGRPVKFGRNTPKDLEAIKDVGKN